MKLKWKARWLLARDACRWNSVSLRHSRYRGLEHMLLRGLGTHFKSTGDANGNRAMQLYNSLVRGINDLLLYAGRGSAPARPARIGDHVPRRKFPTVVPWLWSKIHT
eukprot:SAG25_NODE_43_length_19261_cov_111.931218_8_plen_107_part_00